jgi:hypothetical protein
LAVKPTATPANDRLESSELFAAMTLFLLVSTLHVVYMFHAGGIWRDEVNTFNVATRPNLRDMWSYMSWDSCPILWPLLLRGWVHLGLGSSDLGLRLIGTIIGILILVVLWRNSRQLGNALPFCSLVLIGTNATILHYGDSIRAYGFSVILMILVLTAVWNVCRRPTWPQVLNAAVLSVLSVQSLYHNSIALLAICAGGVAISVRRRDWKTPILLIAIGLISAASLLLPYKNRILGASDWNTTLKMPINLPWLLFSFHDAVKPSGIYSIWIWIGLFAVVLFSAIRDYKDSPSVASTHKDILLFAGTVALVGTCSYFGFLLKLSYITEPWYYISLMALLAPLFDAVTNVIIKERRKWRIGRLVVFCSLSAMPMLTLKEAAHRRQTNLDVVAAQVASLSKRGDLVVVTPWHNGITFARYYHGSAEWTTLPTIEDHLTDRRDLIKRRIQEVNPIQPVLDRMSATLRNGHKIWLVDSTWYISAFARGATLRAPELPSGPLEWPYVNYWMYQTAVHLQSVSVRIKEIPLGLVGPVSPYETATLYAVESQFKNLPNISNRQSN